MNVRATVERLGREHVGKSWWADLAEALVAEFEPVVAERDRYRYALTAIKMLHPGDGCARIARAALDRETP